MINKEAENAKRKRFILAIPSQLDPDGAEALKFISEPFDGLELPDTILSSDAFDKALTVANVTDIVPKTVSRGITLQTKAIKDEFATLLMESFDRIKLTEADSLTIDFGLDNRGKEDNNYEEKVLFLKSLAPHLYRNEMKIRLPARIPRSSDTYKAILPEFIRDSLCGLFRMELNVHPHELLDTIPMEHLAPYRFLMDSTSFAYEPEAGNFLVKKLLEPWFEALNELDFEGNIVFKPLVSSWESLDDAVDSLNDLLKEN